MIITNSCFSCAGSTNSSPLSVQPATRHFINVHSLFENVVCQQHRTDWKRVSDRSIQNSGVSGSPMGKLVPITCEQSARCALLSIRRHSGRLHAKCDGIRYRIQMPGVLLANYRSGRIGPRTDGSGTSAGVTTAPRTESVTNSKLRETRRSPVILDNSRAS